MRKEKKPVKREIRFIDSFRFMGLSLDALIKNLDAKQCKNLNKFYPDPRKFDLLKRKGVYPYDYVEVKSSQVAFNEKTMSIAQLYNVEKNIHETVKKYN